MQIHESMTGVGEWGKGGGGRGSGSDVGMEGEGERDGGKERRGEGAEGRRSGLLSREMDWVHSGSEPL